MLSEISILSLFPNICLANKIVVRVRVGVVNTTYFLITYFVNQNTKNCDGGKRNGESG